MGEIKNRITTTNYYYYYNYNTEYNKNAVGNYRRKTYANHWGKFVNVNRKSAT